MFRNSDDNNFNKNIKLMSLSAGVLVVLFGYTLYKSSASIEGSSYYIGIVFLFILLFIAIGLNLYKDKLREKFNPKSKFESQLQKAKDNNTTNDIKHVNNDTVSTIEAVRSNISFKDVAGINGVKEELEEIVDFLNNPKKYTKYGVSLPKGVLLVGPPGVGKTLVARAVAGEADVPFFYHSGASFVQIYVGMGAKRVRELFAHAKANAPSIVFIDEIDAIGKTRMGSSNDEREATLNELLTQMDGFDGQNGVIVIAATNKIDVLDDALLRAGRFDRRVYLSLPSLEDRRSILQMYLKNKDAKIDIEKLSIETTGFSSAALATLINEAFLIMIKRGGTTLTDEDIEIAKQKVKFGKKEQKILDKDQKEILSIYQSAKGFLTNKLDSGFDKITLFEEGILLNDKQYHSKSEIENMVKKYLVGHVALEVIKGEQYNLFSSDIKEAKELIKEVKDKYDIEISIENIKNDLRTLISANQSLIQELKEQMLEKEILLAKDFS